MSIQCLNVRAHGGERFADMRGKNSFRQTLEANDAHGKQIMVKIDKHHQHAAYMCRWMDGYNIRREYVPDWQHATSPQTDQGRDRERKQDNLRSLQSPYQFVRTSHTHTRSPTFCTDAHKHTDAPSVGLRA